MPSALQQFQENRKQAPQGISRWPGAAVRIGSGTRAGQIDYRKGRVNAVTQNIIKVEMDHPLYPLVVLAGDSYIHVCKSCKRTMTGFVTYQRKPELRGFCNFCGIGHILSQVEVGSWLRLHSRFDNVNGSWAGWYAESWEW